MSTTITGMMKILYQNYLLSESFTLAVSSGETTKTNIYDLDRDTAWTSVNSDDTTEETLQIDFTSSQTIDRILLMNMNFETFDIQYWNGSAWADFSNVYSAKTDAVASDINYTDNTQSTRYFEFTAVSTDKIKISVSTTIITDAQKYIYELYIGQEIGTFTEDVAGDPNSYNPTVINYNSILLKKSNGGMVRVETSQKYNAEFDLSELWESADQTIIQTMFSEGEFAIYPCGADNNYTQIGWRLQDLYSVVIDGSLSGEFSVGRDSNIGINQSFGVFEQ